MERLSLHIEYLLLRHDCVIMPGLGAFIVARYPAYYDKETCTWYPMRREIRFNASVNNDDGLIANSYARKYSISFQKARQLLDSDLRELKELLLADGEITIGRLGNISVSENNLIFEPFSTNIENKTLGLIPVPAILKPAIEDTADVVTETNVVSDRNLNFDKNYYIPVNKVAAKIAASLIFICVIGLSFILPSSNALEEDKASVMPVVENLVTAVEKSKASEKVAEEVSESAESVQPLESVAQMKHFLIVGTFKSESEAQKFISLNSDKGYELKCIPSKTLYRVSAMGAVEKTSLLEVLNSSAFQSIFKEAWIYTSPDK